MQYKHLVYLVLCASLMLFGCDTLEEQPKDRLGSAQFYNTEEDAFAAINSVYAPLNNFGGMYHRGLYHLAELPTDNATPGQGVNNPDIHAFNEYITDPVNSRINAFYSTTYQAINFANSAVGNIPDVEMDEGVKNRLIGEARFIRALMYFNLVRLFGDVPLTTSETASLEDLDVERTPVDQVYDQIVKDLEFAENNLQSAFEAEAGRATKGAAKTMLAKVYLTQGEWEMAASKAKEVMDVGAYSLLPNYNNVFIPENENNREIIFAVQFEAGSGGNGYNARLSLPRNTLPGITGYGADVPTEEFYNSFDSGDTRRDKTFFNSYTMEGTTYRFDPTWFKFIDEARLVQSNDSRTDYPVFRFAEVLLIYAEAINEINGPTPEAREAVNRVIRRAYGEDLDGSSPHDVPAAISKSDFKDLILRERRLEFGNECKRWFDLVRTGRLVEVMRDKGMSNVEEHHMLHPIPQREIDVNPNLDQNPGY